MRRIVLALLGIGALALFAVRVTPAADRVAVRIRLIEAHQGDETKVDPLLADLARVFTAFFHYEFTERLDETMVVAAGAPATVALDSGKTLQVSLLSLTRERATMRLVLIGESGPLLRTRVSAGPRQPLFIAGPRYHDGVLFLAVERR